MNEKKPLYVFFDTEFTGLHQNTTLISIGLKTNDNWFYAEFSDYDEFQVTDWIRNNVISNLKYTPEQRETKEEVKTRLLNWLEMLLDTSDDCDHIQFVSDVCQYDFVLLIDLLTGGEGALSLPSFISPYCIDINQQIAKYYNISNINAFDKSREDIAFELCKYFMLYISSNKLENEIKLLEDRAQKHNSLFDAKIIEIIYKYLDLLQ